MVSVYSGFPWQSKDMHVKLAGDSKLGVNGCMPLCVHSVTDRLDMLYYIIHKVA